MTASPPSSIKRIKLESSLSPRLTDDPATLNEEHLDDDHCVICLQSLVDRTVIPTCSHEFCFECISLWAEQSQKCPLCSQLLGEYLIHHIRSQFDYQKHYLPPPRSKSPQVLPTGETRVSVARRARRERYWGRRDRDADQLDQLERAIAKRRWVYQNHLYAKHVASNSFTRYRPYPTPAQFAASPDMISRATIFLRRELRVWPNLDVEFLTTFTISLMKSIDIRSESAVKLLAELLDLDSPYIEGQRHPNAEHFAHEIYCYIRSGRDLSIYDNLVQYDASPDLPPPFEQERRNRWRYEPQSRSPSLHHRRLHSRSRSPSLALPAVYRESPSTFHPRNGSSDDLSSDPMQRRRTRSIVSERRDIFDASNNSQSHLDDVQQQSVNKSQKGKSKEPERDHTPPLRAQNEQFSSSALPRTSVPKDAVKPQHMAEFHTSRNTTLNTPPVQSDPKHAITPTASEAPAVYFGRNDIEPEHMASTSSKRPSTVGRPPRTLLESVHAHLARNTASRTSKRHAGAGEGEATPKYAHHDTHDGGNNMPAFHSRFSSPPTNALPTFPSAHFLNVPPCSDATTTVGGENTSAKGNHTRGRVRSLPAGPKSPDEDMSFEIMLARPTDGEDKDRSKDEHISASSPLPITDPEGSAPRPHQQLKANSNPISSPHNSNPIHWDKVAEHTRRDHQGAATYRCTYTNEAAAPSPSARSRSSDMRAVLLQRLREEQRVMKSDECSTLHSASTTPVPVSGATNDRNEETEAEALETRLRTRALLRVRLAAIKTAANQSLIES